LETSLNYEIYKRETEIENINKEKIKNKKEISNLYEELSNYKIDIKD